MYGDQLNDLSSGNLLWSGNSRPMPKINIRVPEYTAIPFTKGYIEFKGNLAHGWFENDRYVKNVYMHHKSLILRGGGQLPVKGHYGLHHYAQWGGESSDPEIGILPSGFDDYIWIFQAKMQAPDDAPISERINRLGNHLGSRDIGLDFTFKKYNYGTEYNPKIKKGEFTSEVMSRGCPYRCKFCSRNSVSMKKYRTRSVENVIKELIELSKQGFKFVAFEDDSFITNINEKWKFNDKLHSVQKSFIHCIF